MPCAYLLSWMYSFEQVWKIKHVSAYEFDRIHYHEHFFFSSFAFLWTFDVWTSSFCLVRFANSNYCQNKRLCSLYVLQQTERFLWFRTKAYFSGWVFLLEKCFLENNVKFSRKGRMVHGKMLTQLQRKTIRYFVRVIVRSRKFFHINHGPTEQRNSDFTVFFFRKSGKIFGIFALESHYYPLSNQFHIWLNSFHSGWLFQFSKNLTKRFMKLRYFECIFFCCIL